MHYIVIPGFDHEKCCICNWIPTPNQVSFLEAAIARANSPKERDRLFSELRAAKRAIAAHAEGLP
jgi:hypothetical protein